MAPSAMQPASPSDLICPNPTCQARNSVENTVCHACKTRLPKMVVYAPALEEWSGPEGRALVGDRYRWYGKGVFLDLQPGLIPDAPDEVPTSIANYLRLFAWRPHVPVPYGQVSIDGRSYLLLEGAPVTHTDDFRLPHIRQEWSRATGLRQLNWLWQLAQLWDPLQQFQCEGTLLDARQICVEGSWIRLLSLDYQPSRPPLKLVTLVEEWLGWADKTHPEITKALTHLLQQLMGETWSGAALAAVIQGWIGKWSAAQPLCQTIVATLTDPGPSRDRNEDACYPPSGQVPAPPSDRTLAVVCDGLGGHDSGEVASMLAIETFQTQLCPHLTGPSPQPSSDPATLSPDPTLARKILHQSFLDANHRISERNNQEAREERQRMGTTAVVTLQQERLLYAASLGDSRIYRLTVQGCHQITLDDDLASREVKLGYGFYRDISQAPTGGALVQALGMGASEYLYPSIRPLVLDEDCIFLLCSDGISDFDFVERYWPDIYELLNQGVPLEQVSQKLVHLANQVNGHDNATVALVQVQGELERSQETQVALATEQLNAASQPFSDTFPDPSSPGASTTQVVTPAGQSDDSRSSQRSDKTPDKTQLLEGREPPPSPTEITKRPRAKRSPLPIAIAILSAGLLTALLWPTLRNFITPNRPQPDPSPVPSPIESPSPNSPTSNTADPVATPTNIPTLSMGTLVSIQAPLPDNIPLTLHVRPNSDTTPIFTLSPQQTLWIAAETNIQQGDIAAGEIWLEVEVCGTPTKGWIKRAVLGAIAQPIPNLTDAQRQACTPAPPPPVAPPTP